MIPRTPTQEDNDESIEKRLSQTRRIMYFGLAALTIGLAAQKCNTQKEIERIDEEYQIQIRSPCYQEQPTYTNVTDCYQQPSAN